MIDTILPSNPNDLVLLIIVLTFIGFILGVLLGRSLKNTKYKTELDRCQLEKIRLSNHLNDRPISFAEDNTIKAVLTRGRSGLALDEERKDPPTAPPSAPAPTNTALLLDLDYLGTADKRFKDDLKRIEGIGPFIEGQLNSIGIFTFEQLSKLRDQDIAIITELIEFFPGRIKRDQWKEKAAAFLSLKSNSEKV